MNSKLWGCFSNTGSQGDIDIFCEFTTSMGTKTVKVETLVRMSRHQRNFKTSIWSACRKWEDELMADDAMRDRMLMEAML